MECLSVLVIEDEHDIRVSIRQTLEAEGYFVFSTTNGQSGIELLRRIKPPGLILLDLMMPLCSGFEFLTQKNQDSSISSIPVVVMSAASNSVRLFPTDKVAGFLPKPLELDALLKSVHRYCGMAEQKQEQPGLVVAEITEPQAKARS